MKSVNPHFTQYQSYKKNETFTSWLENSWKRAEIISISTLSPLSVEFRRRVVAAMYKKVEYEEEIDDLIETNLWGLTKSKKNTVDNIFCQTEDSDLGHVRVYSLQSLKQNQLWNSKVMDVIFDHMAATRSDAVSFSHNVTKQELSLLENQI